ADEPVRAGLARERPRLDEGPHALLEEERVALRPRDEERREGRGRRVAAEEGLEQRLRAFRKQRIDAELPVVRLAAPSVAVLGPVVDREEDGRAPDAVGQAV